MSRHSEVKQHILFDKVLLLIYVISTSINIFLFQFIADSLIIRTSILIIALCFITLSIIPYVALKKSKPSLGEKFTVNALTLSIVIMFTLILALTIATTPFYYLSALTVALSVIIMILFGSTSTMFLTEVADMYYKESSVDFLTGLFNRRYFFESSDQITKLARRQQFDISVIMGDIDDFKFINDIFGHDVGDQVIVNFATIIKNFTRDTDITARFGGEEFCLLLPYTDLKGANELAERIRQAITESILTTHICDVRYSVSFGVTAYDITQPLNSAIIQSDRALYYAKEHGKNKVVIFSEDMKMQS